jgi:hypothetical protein
MRSGLRPAGPTDRVLLWRMDGTGAQVWFGCLEDGTVFRKLGGDRWTTVITVPADPGGSFDLVVGMTRRYEDHMVMVGPVEFAVGRRTADDIRGDVNWNDTELSLLVGFDMALRVGKF